MYYDRPIVHQKCFLLFFLFIINIFNNLTMSFKENLYFYTSTRTSCVMASKMEIRYQRHNFLYDKMHIPGNYTIRGYSELVNNPDRPYTDPTSVSSEAYPEPGIDRRHLLARLLYNFLSFSIPTSSTQFYFFLASFNKPFPVISLPLSICIQLTLCVLYSQLKKKLN